MHLNNKILYIFSSIFISTLISCSVFYNQKTTKGEKKVTTGKIMRDQNLNQEKTQIKLYIYPYCMYCKKVINYLRSMNQLEKVTLVDVTNKDNMKELLTLNNHNTQCPFLYDPEKNVKMLESDDIIKYLSTRF